MINPEQRADSEPHAERHVCFLTGTRADFGKLKPLILAAVGIDGIRVSVVATGMHLIERYGLTVIEVKRLEPLVRVVEFSNQAPGDTMDRILSRTVDGLADTIDDDRPDLLVVHGDRVEALAGAAVGALRNLPVAHVEGGELSGTIDGILRHVISKLSHIHLVANEEAARRVVQLGEVPDTVFTIGSPDIDVMLSDTLPSLESVLCDYEIPFDDFALVLFHGITTDDDSAVMAASNALVDALIRSGLRAIVIYPNNDPGTDRILEAYGRLDDTDRFRVFPSVRFEAFLTLLHHAQLLIGNSSAGVREAPIYGIPSVNIGLRQRDRHFHTTIVQAEPTVDAIVDAIEAARSMPNRKPSRHFGRGDSARRFAELLRGDAVWNLGSDKVFWDLDPTSNSAVRDDDVPQGEPR